MIQLSHGRYLGTNKRSFSVEGVIVSETCYHETVFEGWHKHENAHISFILQGGNKEDRKNRTTQVSPGSIVFYHSDELHRNCATQHPSRNINLEVEPDFLKRYDLAETCFENIGNAGDAKFTLLKIFQECKTITDITNASIHLSLLHLLSKKQSDHKHAGWSGQLKELLNDEWNKDHTLNDLSLRLGVHPVTISKGFPRYFSCTLGDYVRKLRIEKAVELICRTDLSLTEIAYHCGFYDQSHFIRTFRSQVGVSPKALKKL